MARVLLATLLLLAMALQPIVEGRHVRELTSDTDSDDDSDDSASKSRQDSRTSSDSGNSIFDNTAVVCVVAVVVLAVAVAGVVLVVVRRRRRQALERNSLGDATSPPSERHLQLGVAYASQ